MSHRSLNYMVYKLCLSNNKYYVGISSRLNGRVADHVRAFKYDDITVKGIDILYFGLTKIEAEQLERDILHNDESGNLQNPSKKLIKKLQKELI